MKNKYFYKRKFSKQRPVLIKIGGFTSCFLFFLFFFFLPARYFSQSTTDALKTKSLPVNCEVQKTGKANPGIRREKGATIIFLAKEAKMVDAQGLISGNILVVKVDAPKKKPVPKKQKSRAFISLKSENKKIHGKIPQKPEAKSLAFKGHGSPDGIHSVSGDNAQCVPVNITRGGFGCIQSSHFDAIALFFSRIENPFHAEFYNFRLNSDLVIRPPPGGLSYLKS